MPSGWSSSSFSWVQDLPPRRCSWHHIHTNTHSQDCKMTCISPSASSGSGLGTAHISTTQNSLPCISSQPQGHLYQEALPDHPTNTLHSVLTALFACATCSTYNVLGQPVFLHQPPTVSPLRAKASNSSTCLELTLF